MSASRPQSSGEAQYLYLTTTGRRTGRAREIEIWFTAAGGSYYVIAEHGLRADWVQNVLADPCVGVRIGGQRYVAHARIVDAQAEPGRVREARARSEHKYGWGDGLVVELCPTTERTAPARVRPAPAPPAS